MKISRLMLFPVLTGLAAPALARPNPEPPPSGIVVHLFGPGSITSNILPTTRELLPAGASAGTGEAARGAPGAAGAATANPKDAANGDAANGDTAAEENEPTMGQVLHQMFVVGDPDQKPGATLAPGRGAEHPRAVNQ